MGVRQISGGEGLWSSRGVRSGIAPAKVVISDDSIDRGSAGDQYIIRCDNNAMPLGDVQIANNVVSSNGALVGIGSLAAQRTSICGNELVILSGQVTYGIVTSPSDQSTFIGNNLGGDADYGSEVIVVFPGQVEMGNALNGQPYAPTRQ